MSNKKANKKNESVVNVVDFKNGTTSVAMEFDKMLPGQRADVRASKIVELAKDALNNGVQQAKLYLEQLTEYQSTDPDGADKLFNAFCKRTGEKPSIARQWIGRYQFVSQFAPGLEQDAVKQMRGTLIETCKGLLPDQLKRVGEGMAQRMGILNASTHDKKYIASELDAKAKETLNDLGVQFKKEKDAKKAENAAKRSQNSESGSVTVSKAWNIPNLENLEPLKMEQRRDAIIRLLQSCREILPFVTDDPLGYIGLDAHAEIIGYAEMVKDATADLEQRLESAMKDIAA